MAAPQSTPPQPTCLVVSDGRRGIENQALGLAEAVARLTALRLLPVHVPVSGELPDPGPISPELWIGCGRAAVRASAVHRPAYPDAVMVYVQNPRQSADRFDLIVAPRHDRMRGSNVLEIIGSPNRLTPQRLDEARHAFADRLAGLPAERAAVLIGGDSRHHQFSPGVIDYLVARLTALRASGIGLMITVSRRTPPALTDRLRQAFAGDHGVWLHDGDGANPYFAFLASADWIFVTEDSTNMLTEAASTGTPVFRLPLDGHPGKFRTLYQELEGIGAVRPWLGRLDRWRYVPLDETGRAARRVLEILDAKTDS